MSFCPTETFQRLHVVIVWAAAEGRTVLATEGDLGGIPGKVLHPHPGIYLASFQFLQEQGEILPDIGLLSQLIPFERDILVHEISIMPLVYIKL